MKTLKEKEYKLFNENGFKTKDIKKFIEDLKKGIKKETYQLWHIELIDKLTGNLE
mgnify:CR=1 FL=1